MASTTLSGEDLSATGHAPVDRGGLSAWALQLATVLMGLIAGFFYAYACSVMVGLAETDDRTFIHTMQSINATVRNAAFAPSFFGALIATAAATALHARERRTAFRWIAAALLLYATAFFITMGISVPLNNELAGAGHPDAIADLRVIRDAYEGPWVRWNIARTLASTAALACLARACMVRQRPTAG